MGKITQQELDRRMAKLLAAQALYEAKSKVVKASEIKIKFPTHSAPAKILADKRRLRDKQLKDKYGIGIAEYDLMASAQRNCCKICSSPCLSLVVDHCHLNGRIRGLLCGHCNSGLGFFRDNKAVLAEAIEYLQSNSNDSPVA